MENKDKIALCLIVKGTGDEPVNLRRALQSVARYVDSIYITLTGPKEEIKEAEKVCQEFKANVSYGRFLWEANKKTVAWLKKFLGYEPHMKVGDKIFLFDEARNFNFSQVSQDYQWILWMDCDDVFQRGENLRKLVELAQKAQIDAFYLNYIYQAEVDENFNIKQVIIEHLRERLIRNIGIFKWIAPIHETLIEQRPSNKTDNYDCDVLHLATMEDRVKSLTRNLNNLELAIYQSEGKDPRHIYYLAKAYFDERNPESNEKAIPLIMQYLYGENKSGWPEERSQACEYLAEIYRQKGELNNAVKAGMNALIEQPDSPSIFTNLAISYIMKQDWDRALFWVRVATSLPERKTTLVKSPRDAQGMILEVIYNASLNKGMIDEAWAAAVKLQELAPSDLQVNNIYNFISQLREQRDITKIVVRLADYLKKTGEYHKVKPLLAATPQIAENTPFIIDLIQKNNPPKYWEDDEIAIYCGPGFTNWSPKRLSDPREAFVGGSEEAVILMSQELAKLGWKITVYADPGQEEGEYDGVKWLPYYKFNRLDHFNIIIAWRQFGFVDLNVQTKKLYIWNHDICNPLEWTNERTDKITKAFFLSKWHRDNVPDLSEEKVMITSNGINLKELDNAKNIKSDSHKCFYGSSYDRGLNHLLEMWPDIKSAVPTATLEIAYGWKLFDQFYSGNPASMAWKAKMVEMMKQSGITEHDRLPQPEVIKLMKQCSVWAYPTHFGEINCINALKSQALGLCPVVVNYAALRETVQFGRKIEGDIYDQETKEAYKKELIDALKNPMPEEKRQEMMKWAREKYAWSKIAQEWSEEFKK